MACHTKAGTAQFVNYFEDRYGVKITQDDWHAVRTLAEVEKGSTLRRSKLSESDTEKLIKNLTNGDDSDAPNQLQEGLEKERPTEGTARALYYLQNYGVSETLEKVRERRKSHGKVGSYGIKITVAEDGAARDYVFNVSTAEDAGNLVKSTKGLVTYEVAETQDDGSIKVMDPTDAMRFVEHGWAEYKDMNAVIPDSVSYAVEVRTKDPQTGYEQKYNFHAPDRQRVRDIVEGTTGSAEFSVSEERTGRTLANPNDVKTEWVELSDDDIKDMLADD